jgi:hypothetical protein
VDPANENSGAGVANILTIRRRFSALADLQTRWQAEEAAMRSFLNGPSPSRIFHFFHLGVNLPP